MKDTKLLEQLGDTKLKWPKGLRKYIYESTHSTGNQQINVLHIMLIRFIEIWRKRLLMRTFVLSCSVKGVNRPFKMGIPRGLATISRGRKKRPEMPRLT